MSEIIVRKSVHQEVNAKEAVVIAFRRKRKPVMKSPEHFLLQQRCLFCGVYGCVIRKLSPDEHATGDNLLPLCQAHAHLPLSTLYQEAKVRQWLNDHDRIDVVIYLEAKRRKQ